MAEMKGYDDNGDDTEVDDLQDSQQTPPSTPRNYENVISAMGLPNRYQIIQCLLLSANWLPLAYININFVFIAFQPPFSCSAVNETSFLQTHPSIINGTGPYQFSYDKCDIHLTSNASGTSEGVVKVDCYQGYSYDGGKQVSLITEWDLVCNARGMAELSQSLLHLGWCLGFVIASMISDKYGRKKTMVIATTLFSVSELCSAFVPNIYAFMTLRLFSGILAPGITGVSYVIGAEHLVSKSRESFTMFIGIVWSLYAAIVCIVAYLLREHAWRDKQMCAAFSTVVPLVCLFFVDESASWLYSKGKHHRATLIIKKACRINAMDFMDIKNIWDKLCTQETKQHRDEKEAKNYNMLDIIRNKKLRFYTFIGWMMCFTNSTTYYGTFLSASNLAGDLYLNATVMALLELPGCFVVLWMLRYKGRRFVMIFFTSMAAISLLISTCLGPDITPYNDHVAKASTSFFLLGKFAIGNSFNAVVLYIPEIYPTTLRSSGVGICGTGACLGAMLSPFVNPLHAVATWAPGVFLTSIVVITVILMFKLPETKGKQLPSTLNDSTLCATVV